MTANLQNPPYSTGGICGEGHFLSLDSGACESACLAGRRGRDSSCSRRRLDPLPASTTAWLGSPSRCAASACACLPSPASFTHESVRPIQSNPIHPRSIHPRPHPRSRSRSRSPEGTCHGPPPPPLARFFRRLRSLKPYHHP